MMREFINEPFDYVITVCDRAKDSCPLWPHAAELIHWSFEDPAETKWSPEERQGLFRKVRNEIRARIEEFISDN
jgi:arsenate reductase (thioredoxin)